MEVRTLTPELQEALDALEGQGLTVTELRFRVGRPASAVIGDRERPLKRAGQPITVTDRLVKTLLDRATGCSPYALRLEESGLYLPLERGCRMGLAGEALMREGRLVGLKSVSALALRLAIAHQGIAEELMSQVLETGPPGSVLIVSPPGGGKTTLLRELVRRVSDQGWRISLVDERRELAACVNGVPQLDVGACTDVLSGCGKREGMALMLRVMNPQVLAVDELSGQEELETVREAVHWGVAVFATAHGRGLCDLRRRAGFPALLEEGVFSTLAVLRQGKLIEMERLNVHD